MGWVKDLTGQRFGRLVVVKKANGRGSHNSYWECICDCGSTTVVSRPALVQKKTTSCGCLQKEIAAQISPTYNVKHGESVKGKETREYRCWRSIKDRCCNEKNTQHHRYGGRGIHICDEWRNDYQKFLSDMGRCPDGHSIERIDNNKGYLPDNCKWGTLEEQNNNRKDSCFVSYNGKTMTISQWARATGIKKITLWQRLKRFGWSAEKALTTPVGG